MGMRLSSRGEVGQMKTEQAAGRAEADGGRMWRCVCVLLLLCIGLRQCIRVVCVVYGDRMQPAVVAGRPGQLDARWRGLDLA